MKETVRVSGTEAPGSKTLLGGEAMKEPSWLVWTLVKAFRLVVLTVLWAGLGMGVGLFFGIFSLLIWGAFTHLTPDMESAYRSVAIPLAIGTGSCAFLWNLLRTVQAAVRRQRGE